MQKDNTIAQEPPFVTVDLEKQSSVDCRADECASVEVNDKHQWTRRDFRLIVASNLFFTIASVLYLWLAVLDLQWVNEIQGVPEEALEADDDITYSTWFPDDDVVFVTPNSNVYVSEYMIIYFCAAFCYVVTGFLECVWGEGCFGIFLLLAGLFGLLSSMFVEKNEDLSNTFDLVSCNLFLLEAVQVFCRRHSFTGAAKLWHRLADGLFLAGAIGDVTISYVNKFEDMQYSQKFAAIGVFDSSLWIVSALIYLSITVHWRVYNKPESCKVDNEVCKELDRQETDETEESP